MSTKTHPQAEWAGVLAWRCTQLLHAGFDEALATRIACDGRYDLHRLIELAESGCEPRLAVRILAPLDEDEAA